MNRPLKVGALFAGYSGLELALQEVLDVEPAWFVEFDKGPSAILAHRYPDVPNLHDVTKVDWTTVEPVDVITGGSPCQDLSHAGKRLGMKAGTRSGLWASMCDAIDIIRPRLVIWENVRGALSAPADSAVEPCPLCVGDRPGVSLRALGRVLGDLAELGYDAAWHGLRAADVGAPHGRWRVFLLAWQQGDLEPVPTRPGTGGVGGGSSVLRLLPTPEAKLGSSGPDYARATRPGTGGDSLHEAIGRLLPTPRATRGGSGTETMYGLGAERSDDGRPQGEVLLLPTPTTEPTTGNGHARNLGAEARAAALLPTPTAQNSHSHGNTANGRGELLPPGVVELLPTPAVNDMGDGKSLEWWDEWAPRQKSSKGAPAPHGKSLAIEALRLLPTPVASDVHHRQASENWKGYDLVSTVGALLPTPTTTDHKASGSTQARTDTHHTGRTLTDVTVRGHGEMPAPGRERLLPTPQTTDAASGHFAAPASERGGHQIQMSNLAADSGTQWGAYAPAVTRWEQASGRPAPSPTERDWARWREQKRRRLESDRPVGLRGSIRFLVDGPPARLSPAFVEWMMGLPAGWVTDPAIWEGWRPGAARNAQLKALGNGVPQQCAAALRHLLEVRAMHATQAVAS